MSQFDESTERKAKEAHAMIPDTKNVLALKWEYLEAWKEGRRSAKESLETLARLSNKSHDHNDPSIEYGNCDACLAIAAVKRLGDWPLEINKAEGPRG